MEEEYSEKEQDQERRGQATRRRQMLVNNATTGERSNKNMIQYTHKFQKLPFAACVSGKMEAEIILSGYKMKWGYRILKIGCGFIF